MPEVAILKRVRMIDKLFYCGATKTSSIKRPLMMIIICNSNHDRNYHFIWPFCLIADIVYVVVKVTEEEIHILYYCFVPKYIPRL